MTSIVSTRASPELLQRWRQQISCRQRRRVANGPRPLAAIGYRAFGPVCEGLVYLRRLLFVALYDEVHLNGCLVTRVAAYLASAVPWGVRIGGAEQCRVDKDLARPPTSGGKGRRFDLAREGLISLALDLDRSVEQHLKFPHQPRLRQPRWPELWAAFEPHTAAQLHGAGPEFESLVRQTGNQSSDVLQSEGRPIAGLRAFPLAHVSHAWQQITGIYADLTTLPKRQVIALDHPLKDLCGYSASIEYDLVHSRFTFASTASAR